MQPISAILKPSSLGYLSFLLLQCLTFCVFCSHYQTFDGKLPSVYYELTVQLVRVLN